MDLDFDKYCVVDGSPTTVLEAPRCHLRVSSRKSSGKPKCDDCKSILKEGFSEIRLNHYRSASCRDRTSGRLQHGRELLKRGSVYQSSKDVRLMKKTDAVEARQKIEFSRGSASTISFRIIDSLCSSDDEDSSLLEPNRASLVSLSEQSTSSVRRSQTEFNSRDSLTCSFPPLPPQLPGDGSNTDSPKARFSTVRKMFDPFVKSKVHKSPLSSSNDTGWENRNRMVDTSHEPTTCSTYEPNHEEFSFKFEMKENHISIPQLSPAHLHGLLKLEYKHGVPFFKFSVKSPQEVYVAKMSKVENSSNWVYTFHSIHGKRKSNASGWGLKESNRGSSIAGQMHASCYLHTEIKDIGALNESMVTDFVLSDVSCSRKRISVQDNSRHLHDDRAQTVSNEPCDIGRAPENLGPELEIAAVVMQMPLKMRESLKFKSGDRMITKTLPNLLDVSSLEQKKELNSNTSIGQKMHVVIPSGNHSVPGTESRGPLPLLDRWRLGGGCDCGGWDMACPIDIFGNENIQIGESIMDNQQPVQLFVQGKKDKLPAFMMTVIEDGKYAVDFHARLSSLQAFSICAAILHISNASTLVGRESTKEILRRDSLRVFAEEEFKNLIDGVEEKLVASKKMGEPVPSLVLNPPFSPIARV
ncbi:uncharacterized protein [Primulina eburnea]|uniref:uncharacterized protein n=1 Tax=Primulina eburnea TaxID=1245227 RepID=UPI003C6C4AEC